MDKGLYVYDPDTRQYRRRYGRDRGASGESDAKDSGSDIYAKTGHVSSHESGRFHGADGTRRRSPWIFWLGFFVVAAVWIAALYLLMREKTGGEVGPAGPAPAFEQGRGTPTP